MHHPKIDKKMSKWVAKNIDSKPKHYFMNALMSYIRESINNNRLEEAEKKWYLT